MNNDILLKYFSIKVLWYSIILSILSVSCEEKMTINKDANYEPKLVVTGFIGNQNPALVYIQKTQHPLRPSDDKEIAADVLLITSDKSPISMNAFEVNFYTTNDNVKGVSGSNYNIKVISTEFGTAVSATVTKPDIVRIDSAVFVRSEPNNGNIHLFFTDKPGKNFYAVKVLKYLTDGTLYDRDDTWYALVNPYSVFDDLGSTNGLVHTINPLRTHHYVDNTHLYISEVKIILYHLDAAAFFYFRSLKDFEYTRGDIMTDPTIIYSNIRNGYGIFGSFATDTLTLEIK